MRRQDFEQSQYYQEDFLANHSVQPGSAEARRMTVTSGRKCCELYRKSGPLGSLVRMLLESSAWRSTRCYLTWKASATPAKRLLFRLVPSTPRTEGTGSQLLPTAVASDYMGFPEYVRFFPTPTARDCKGANSMEHLTRDGKRNHTDQLANAVRFWPTPTQMDAHGLEYNLRKDATGTRSILLSQKAAMYPSPTTRDYKSPDLNPESKRFSQKTELNSVVGGQLNPTWVEWIMGFPLGWTDLSASETPLCPSSSTQSSGL